MAEILNINPAPTKDVRLFRLRHTPEEFIAEVVSESDDGRNTTVYNIKMPVMPMQHDGQLGFAPWAMLSSVQEFAIQASDLLYSPRPPLPSIVSAYIYHTTGIETEVPSGLKHKIVAPR